MQWQPDCSNDLTYNLDVSWFCWLYGLLLLLLIGQCIPVPQFRKFRQPAWKGSNKLAYFAHFKLTCILPTVSLLNF
jgi:hypothetical protein